MTVLDHSPECFFTQCPYCGAALRYSVSDICPGGDHRGRKCLVCATFFHTEDLIRCPICGACVKADRQMYPVLFERHETPPRSLEFTHWEVFDECANAGIYCAACHKKVFSELESRKAREARFCPNCGRPVKLIQAETAHPALAVANNQTPAAGSAESESHWCNTCKYGTNHCDQDGFCTYCEIIAPYPVRMDEHDTCNSWEEATP